MARSHRLFSVRVLAPLLEPALAESIYYNRSRGALIIIGSILPI